MLGVGIYILEYVLGLGWLVRFGLEGILYVIMGNIYGYI